MILLCKMRVPFFTILLAKRENLIFLSFWQHSHCSGLININSSISLMMAGVIFRLSWRKSWRWRRLTFPHHSQKQSSPYWDLYSNMTLPTQNKTSLLSQLCDDGLIFWRVGSSSPLTLLWRRCHCNKNFSVGAPSKKRTKEERNMAQIPTRSELVFVRSMSHSLPHEPPHLPNKKDPAFKNNSFFFKPPFQPRMNFFETKVWDIMVLIARKNFSVPSRFFKTVKLLEVLTKFNPDFFKSNFLLGA